MRILQFESTLEQARMRRWDHLIVTNSSNGQRNKLKAICSRTGPVHDLVSPKHRSLVKMLGHSIMSP